jgi:hypothetical protein
MNMMPDETFGFTPDPLSFSETLAQRKESAGRTLRQASAEELRTLIAELFPDKTHPFAEPFSRFIEAHQSERAVRGETSDGIAFVYYPQLNRGVWYQYAGAGNLVGVGLIGETSLKALSEIVAQTGRF